VIDTSLGHLTSAARIVSIVRAALIYATYAALLAQFGLLALAGFIFAAAMMTVLPLTLDSSLWYFPQAAIGAGVLVAGAAFCCWTATGGNRLIPEGFFGDE
jgi:hypothetical protein